MKSGSTFELQVHSTFAPSEGWKEIEEEEQNNGQLLERKLIPVKSVKTESLSLQLILEKI